jgi:hypothetical protein
MRLYDCGYAQTTINYDHHTWQIELYSTYKDFIICRNFDKHIDIIIKHIVPQKGGKINPSIRPFTTMKVSANNQVIIYSKRGLATMKLSDILERKRVNVKAKVYSISKDMQIPNKYDRTEIGDLIIADRSTIAVAVNCKTLALSLDHYIEAYVVFIDTDNGCIWRTERLDNVNIKKMLSHQCDKVLAICDNEYRWHEDFTDSSTILHKNVAIYTIERASGVIIGKLTQSVEPTQ